MATEEPPSKNDLNLIFKRLRSLSANKSCFDCSAKNPTWASVTYGVFICIDCSAIHRSLGVHLSFVKSTQLDTNWTWIQLRGMQVGGNSNAEQFFIQHNCTTRDAQQKYNSRAAQLYREKLLNQSTQAHRLHGTKALIDSLHPEPPPSPDQKDFFDETELILTSNIRNIEPDTFLAPANIAANIAAKNADNSNGEGPSVEAALSTSPTEAMKMFEARKPTIGQRKPAAKKGMGAKKAGGLGAQRVATNFTQIEKEAEMQDKMKEEAAAEEKVRAERSKEDEEKQMASIRLAYKDLSIQQERKEEKMKNLDPAKAAQMERLGMASFSKSTITHSALSDMKTIEQDHPKSGGGGGGGRDRDRDVYKDAKDYFEDDFEIISFSSGLPKYRDSPFGNSDRFDSGSKSSGANRKSGWGDESGNTKSFFDEMLISKEPDDSSSARRKPSLPTPVAAGPTSDAAVQKFGNAKSISSEQFFGGSSDMDYERRSNLARFEGSSSISSADYFGDGSSSAGGGGGGGRYGGGGAGGSRGQPSFNAPDLDEIREGVRAGVTKVAGRLSNLANGVMNSLQDRYGY